MFCRKCGNQLSDHMKFCPKCGASVITQPAQDTQATAASAETAVPVTETAVSAETTAPVAEAAAMPDAPTSTTAGQATQILQTAQPASPVAPTEQGATQATAAPTAPVAEATAMPDATAATTAGQATQILQTAQPTSPVAPMPQVAQAPTPAPTEKKKGGMKWVFIGIAAVLLIAAIVFVLFFLRGKDEKDTVTDGTVEETEVSRSKKGEVSFDFHSITTSDSLENVTILVMSGHSNIDGEPLETLTTDGDGKVSVELESGEYTLVWKKDGYYNGCRDLDVENEAVTVTTYMLPLLSDHQAYILLRWDSDQDLDLSVFNAQTNQYINITSPVDASGNFLYSDNTGEQGYELIYLRDYTEGIYTVYVRDNESLVNGTGSSMEAGNVSVSVYIPDGLIYYKEADTTEDAALWNPVYLYQGEPTDLNNYIHDLTDYPQLARDKNDLSVVRNEEAMKVYEAFLRGEYTTKDGKTLTGLLPEFSPADDTWNGYIDKVEYAYLDLGADNVQELLVTFIGFDVYEPGDDSSVSHILQYDGTDLNVCYSFGSYARGVSGITYYGVLNWEGYAGATSTCLEQSVLDSKGNELMLYSADAELEINSYTYTFDDNGFDPTSYSDMPDAGLCFYEINGTDYIAYENDMNEGRADYDAVSAFYGSHGYQIYTQEEIETLVTERARSLGIEEWILHDNTQPQVWELDTQYYQDYLQPDELVLTDETMWVLCDIAFDLYGKEGTYYPDYLMQNSAYLHGFLSDLFLQMRMGLTIPYLDVEWQKDASDPYSYREYTKISAATVGNFLTQLFGGTYDLTTFTHDADAFVDLYYDNGQLICFAGGIELDEGAWYERTEDVYDQYKDVVFSVGGNEYVAGSVTLSLRMVNNDLGYMITSYTCSKYSR